MKKRIAAILTLIVAAIAAFPLVRYLVREYKYEREYSRVIEAKRREAAEWEAYIRESHAYTPSAK